MLKKTGVNRFIGFGVILLSLSLGATGLKTVWAEDNDEYEVSDVLLKALPLSKHTLADGIGQVTKGTETAISAKFEMDDKGKLSLSVYTAEKGLTQDAEHNTFKEISGSSDTEAWNPETEIIKEGEDLENAKEQLKVLSTAKFSLLDFIAKAEKDQPGTVLSIMPEFEDGKNVCELRILSQGKIVEIHYDVVTGEKANMD